jgi:hypothetical protein
MSSCQAGWPADVICLDSASSDLSTLASTVYSRVCRIDLSVPGFCLVNLGSSITSVDFRRLMVDLKMELSAIHERTRKRSLILLSAIRVDQQHSTKLHLDGGPEESLLMLGYEPSEIASEIAIADYARNAADLGISPKEFMDQHNPMFHSGQEMLRPYISPVPCFSSDAFQILIVNNSSAEFDSQSWQGTLHAATIPAPDDSGRRIINSMMIASALTGSPEVVTAPALRDFVHTSSVRRGGYDKPDLPDDPEK